MGTERGALFDPRYPELQDTDCDRAWLAWHEQQRGYNPLDCWRAAWQAREEAQQESVEDLANALSDQKVDSVNQSYCMAVDRARAAEQERDRALAEVGRLEAVLPDPDKLIMLAEWLNLKFPDDANPEVQQDLLEWGIRIKARRAALQPPVGET